MPTSSTTAETSSAELQGRKLDVGIRRLLRLRTSTVDHHVVRLVTSLKMRLIEKRAASCSFRSLAIRADPNHFDNYQSSMQRIPYFIAPLASTRSVLALTGTDAPKFLQGLVTNDILNTHHASTSATPSVYAGFLSAPGRVLHDTFILPPVQTDKAEYLIDYPKNVADPPLLKSIKRYILRSKVKAREASDEWRLWAIFPDPLKASRLDSNETPGATSVEEELAELSQKHAGKWWKDTRNAKMGYRLLLPPSSVASVQESRFQSATPSLHTLLRYVANVPEAPTDLIPNQSLPLESNMDVMGASKGVHHL